MLKLKIELDPKNQKEMEALAAFATVLAFDTQKAKEPATVKNAQPSGLLQSLINSDLKPSDFVEVKAESAPEPENTEAEKPKRTRRSKAEMEAAEKKEEQSTDSESEQEGEAENATEQDAEEYGAKKSEPAKMQVSKDAPSLSDIQKAVVDRKDVYLGAMKNKLKTAYGCKTVHELAEKDYSEFYAFVLQLSEKDLSY